jgi:large subunit ribosomal protein L24
MIKSGQRRKQRRFRFTAPLHERQKFAHAHISKELREKLGIKMRSIQIRKGDSVKVMSGKYKKLVGAVKEVDMKNCMLTIDSIKRKTAKGKEVHVPIHISNVYITDLDLGDKLRKAKIDATKAK